MTGGVLGGGDGPGYGIQSLNIGPLKPPPPGNNAAGLNRDLHPLNLGLSSGKHRAAIFVCQFVLLLSSFKRLRSREAF